MRKRNLKKLQNLGEKLKATHINKVCQPQTCGADMRHTLPMYPLETEKASMIAMYA